MEKILKEYLPIIISVLSLVLAMFSLGWNVYRDIILKPRVRVSIKRGVVMTQHGNSDSQLFISAVNHGPGRVRLSMIWYRERSLLRSIFRKNKQGVVIYDYLNPLSGRLPATLEVGEEIEFIFPWNENCVLSRAPTHLGLRDSFDRFHWAPRKQLRVAVNAWKRQFASYNA